MKKTAIMVICLSALILVLVSEGFVEGIIMKDNKYYYSERHVEEEEHIEPPKNSISEYDRLVSAIKDMIISVRKTESLTVSNYNGDLMQDLKRATDELMQEYPLGNWAVSSIVYNPTFVSSYCELQVVINYNHTYEEIISIAQVMSEEELEERIVAFIKSLRTKRVFDLSDIYIGDTTVREIFEKCWMQSDLYAYGLAEVVFNYYPRNSDNCLLEIVLSRSDSGINTEDLVEMTEKNIQYIIAECDDTGTSEKIDFIKYYLENNVKYDAEATKMMIETEGRQTRSLVYSAQGAINEKKAAQTGMVLAANVLLTRMNVQNSIINGEYNGDPYSWITVRIGNQQMHFDPTAVFVNGENAKYLFTEEEARERFSWNRELFR